jgi:hypothetical protein
MEKPFVGAQVHGQRWNCEVLAPLRGSSYVGVGADPERLS